MSDSEMTWDVDMAVADVWLAVHHAVIDAVDDAMCWAVWRAVASPVDDAVYDAGHGDPPRPSLQDFLRFADVGET